MPTERCGICGTKVPMGHSTHLLVNPADGEVTDHYVCGSCYEAEVVPLLDLSEES